jgi:putative protein kinase ArgK-like GTPase of G3E family
MPTISVQVLEQLENIKLQLSAHYEREKAADERLAGVYKILVTGNGTPPLPEMVRKHEDWICEQKEDKKVRDKERRSFFWAIAMLILTNAVAIFVAIVTA